ncbi:MAG: flotillin family protein [Alphaproteobacteria bacterium]|nr:MAG: flotillin family protein [Alphaproteobacteria bacterium]
MIWFAAFICALVFLLIAILFLKAFYQKATREMSLVRTGFGGQKVVIDGGCIALPILHQAQKVMMSAIPVTVVRRGDKSFISKDHLRLDIEMSFEVRVTPTHDGVATAAQALGPRIARSSDALHEVLESKIIDTIQAASAASTLEEIHENRKAFTDEIASAVSVFIEGLGLRLESSSLLHLDQAAFATLDENNVFNAIGMRKVSELVSRNRRERIRIETEADISVRESRLAQVQRRLELEREEKESEISQQAYLTRLAAETEAQSVQAKVKSSLMAEETTLSKERDIKAFKIEHDETLRRKEMDAIRELEGVKIDHAIFLAAKRAEEAKAKAAEESSKSQVILAAEAVHTEKEEAVAVREEKIALLRLRKELSVKQEAAKNKAETEKLLAEADARNVEVRAQAEKARLQAEAEGLAAKIKAENGLSDAVISMRLEKRKLDRMPEILGMMMKPVEKIDSIRINQIGGLGNGAANGGGGVDGAFGAAMDQILGMAVRLPAMKQMGEEIGVDFDANLAGRMADYANRIKSGDKTKKD